MSIYFPYFITTCISPWKKTWSFILTNLNTLCPMMVCAKCCGHWLSGALIVLEKKVFEKTLINVFSFTGYCLPLEIVLSFILTISKGCFVTSLMQSKLAHGFLRRRLNYDKFTERRTKGDQKKKSPELSVRWTSKEVQCQGTWWCDEKKKEKL